LSNADKGAVGLIPALELATLTVCFAGVHTLVPKLASLSRNWTCYPVSEKDFCSGYASICAHGHDRIGATNVCFLPLFVVLAILAHLSPEHIGGDACMRRITSLCYYWSCQYLFLVISDLLKRKSACQSLLIAATGLSKNCAHLTSGRSSYT